MTSKVGGTTPVKGIEGPVDSEADTSFGRVGGASSSLSFGGIGARASLSFRAEVLTGLRTAELGALIPTERQGDGAALIWSK